MYFDAHADIWTHVARKRSRGEQGIFKRYHLPEFRQGGIGGGIFVVWTDQKEEPKGRMLEILGKMAVELKENQDILFPVRASSDLEEAWETDKLTVIMGLEGLSGIGEDLDLLYMLYHLGFRHASLTWNEENPLATGVSGNPERGLTELGRQAVRTMEELGMIIDVSHLNETSFWDLLQVVDKPVIASHSNCKALCNVPRNLTDEQIAALAGKGGVIGINVCPGFINEEKDKQDVEHLADHLEHLVEIAGIEHAGFGFDFCDYLRDEDEQPKEKGMGTRGIEDASRVPNLIKVLEERGYSSAEIELLSYQNFFRVFKELLP
ncbi:MAG: membrane dipeptidase [Halanaerobium sp.]|nr:membrane dipeptidase [Halanaerobium sp.]